MLHPIGIGSVPGSDVGHLSLFGYRRTEHYSGRGPIEALGLGLDLRDSDVALRANFCTIKDDQIIDRRAGRIESVQIFAKALDGLVIEDVQFLVRAGTGYRAALVMRGPDLSPSISDTDTHHLGETVPAQPLDRSPEAQRTAALLNNFIARSHGVLSALPANAERTERGLLPANYLIFRGAGRYRRPPSFEELHGLRAVCVAGGGLYKGLGAYVGMRIVEVPGATARPGTNLRGKVAAALDALRQCDFAYLHIKPADVFGHDGDSIGKRDFISEIDRNLGDLAEGGSIPLIVVTADHSTPCALARHSADPVPVLIAGPSVRTDRVREFGERAAAEGGLSQIRGSDLMPLLKGLLGTAPLIGA